MAATTVAALTAIIRRHLNEPTADHWSDAELAALLNLGAQDLFRAINDNYQDYFVTIDTTHVTQAANATSLSGVPADVGIVRGLEPASLTARPGLIYEQRDYMHIDMQRARALSAQDPSFGLTVYWCVTGAGAPVAAPTIQVAPMINAAVALRLVYVPMLSEVAVGGSNPLPGITDNALVAWTVAYALAKRTEEQEPHAGWLTLYATEKQNLLTSLTPRQTEDDTVVDAMFEDLW